MTSTASSSADPAPPTDDAALVASCLAGDGASWEALVRTYAPLVYSIARRAGLTPHEAEDASQAVFSSLLQSLRGLRDGQSVAKWIIVVTKRQSWRILRSRLTPIADSEGGAPAAHADDPDELWARRQAVRQALASLGGRCQDLLSALFTDRNRADYSEVSARLGIPVGSIGPTRNRCLRKLMDVLGSMQGSAVLWDEAERDALQGRLHDPA